jgi:hypothetical protein
VLASSRARRCARGSSGASTRSVWDQHLGAGDRCGLFEREERQDGGREEGVARDREARGAVGVSVFDCVICVGFRNKPW